jgi:hypothetical protein
MPTEAIPAEAAATHGSQLPVAHPKHGLGLRPKRWVVEPSFDRVVRFRHLARDDA